MATTTSAAEFALRPYLQELNDARAERNETNEFVTMREHVALDRALGKSLRLLGIYGELG